ncbi:MAG TPA: NfeD family protein [Actinomycetota bacterium]|nr:NfeD family protein [Actinomycetota bacterium]
MALLIGGTLAIVLLSPPWSVVVIVLLVGVEVFEFRLWRWALRQRPRAGIEGMVGERGRLTAPKRVRMRGTSYAARAAEGGVGDPVEVEAVEGMTLVVRRVAEA